MARKGYWGMGLMKNTDSVEEKILNKPWILLLGWTPQSIVFYGPYLYLLGRWRLKNFCSEEFLRPSLSYSFCFVLFLAMCFLQKGFPCGSAGEESACNVGELGSIPGLGRSPGKGNSYPLQYSGLENSKNCIVHGLQRISHNWATFTFTSFKSARLLIWVFPVNSINDQWSYSKFLPGLCAPAGCISLFFSLCWILSN